MGNGRGRFTALLLLVTSLLAVGFSTTTCVIAARGDGGGRTPVVLFPAFYFTKLEITVDNQTAAPDCPRSGTFQTLFQNTQPSTTFSQVCRDELLTLRYDPDPSTPMPVRFANQLGVTVRLVDYGTTRSAPFYRPMYQALERAGYVADRDIRVAGYDSRLTPDLGGFLERTRTLIETTYAATGDRPVQLVGHSNGPLYAQYLLTHTSAEWRHRYIHGFTPIAGNFPGQGLLYATLFTGLNVEDFSNPSTAENAASSARMYLSSPSSYMSAADPAIFGDQEVVVENAANGRRYTPSEYAQLFTDAGLPQALQIARYYLGFVKFAGPEHFPDVDVDAEHGSGSPTVVGTRLKDLTIGQAVTATTVFFNRDGDKNQEDLTNLAVLAWRAIPCYHVSVTDNPGVDHFALPSDPAVLNRLLDDLTRPSSSCG